MEPRVSIVVPVKNVVNTIRDLLDSLMQVEYDKAKLEIIIVDGNSTDGTREIASEYPVKLLTQDKPGINVARNIGVRHSSGEIIAFTDGDCVVPRNWVRKIVGNFEASDVGCLGGNAKRFHDDFLSRYSDESIMPVLRRFDRREVLDSVKPPLKYPAGFNMAVRRNVVEKVGLFDEGIVYGFDEDELVERICKDENKMVLDPEVLVIHKHRSSLSGLLKQNFRYGRGIGIVYKTKGRNSTFSNWIRICIAGFFIWFLLIPVSAYFAFLTRLPLFLATSLAFTFLPIVGLIIFYASQTFKMRDNHYGKIITYPFIDIMRSVVFVFGGIYQLLKRRR